jgi:Holliday junction resolvase RusA-like endonuclease
MAQVHMVRARTEQGWAIAEPREALVVLIQARYSCPRSEHRKRDPRPARWHTGRGDSDNVAKAVLDAGTGVLWVDDAQVSRLVVTKWVGAQGEPPQVVVNVRILPGRGPEDRR